MWWGILPKTDILSDAHDAKWRVISQQQLVDLLRFDMHPRTFERQLFRRHHKTKEITMVERTPLGFSVETKMIKRS
jgi:hypothetical protein